MINADGVFIGEISRPDLDLLGRLANCHAASVANPMTLGAAVVLGRGAIKPISPHMRAFGPAVTVHVDHIDHLTPLTAATVAEAGDVLVIAAGGRTDAAIWGHGLSLAAQASGVSAVVVDGAVVNLAELLDMGVPTFARGTSPTTGSWDGPGAINVDIEIDGLVVHPGDVVVGDGDGVVVIPREKLHWTIEQVESHEAENVRRRALLAQGVPLLEIVREAKRTS